MTGKFARKVMDALVKIGPRRQVVAALSQRLLDEREPCDVAAALARLGSEGVVALRNGLLAGEIVQQITILKQAPTAGPDAVPLLLAGLHHPVAEVRVEAICAAWDCGLPPARFVPWLLAASRDPVARVRDCAVSGLGCRSVASRE